MIDSYDELQILAYVEGEMDPDELHQFKLVLMTDARLKRLVDQLVADRDALRNLPQEEAPAELMDRVEEHLERDMLLRPAGPSSDARMVVERRFKLVRIATFAGLAAMLLLGVSLMISTFKEMGQIDRLEGIGPVAMEDRATADREADATAEVSEPKAESPARQEEVAEPAMERLIAGELKASADDVEAPAPAEPVALPAMAMAKKAVAKIELLDQVGAMDDGAVLKDQSADKRSEALPASPVSPAPVARSAASTVESLAASTAPAMPMASVSAVPAISESAASMETEEVIATVTDPHPMEAADIAGLITSDEPVPGKFPPLVIMSAPVTAMQTPAVADGDAVEKPKTLSIEADTRRPPPRNLSLAVVTMREENALMRLIRWARVRGVTIDFGEPRSTAKKDEPYPGADLLPKLGHERIRLSMQIKARHLSELVDMYDLNNDESAYLVREPRRRTTSSVLTEKEERQREQRVARKSKRANRTPEGWIDFGDLIAQELPVDPTSLKLDPDEDLTIGLIIRNPVGVRREAAEQEKE